MKYYVNGQCGHKLLLNVEGEFETRAQIQSSFAAVCSEDGIQGFYSNRSVVAEPTSGQAAKGAGIGVVVGILLGPIFALAAGSAGLLAGRAFEKGEQERAARFNNS